MKPINIYVVGCGGIGGFLIPMLPQVLSSVCLDACPEATQANLMRDTTQYIPSMNNCLRTLYLIDKDVFDPHNALRQAATAGSKLEVQMMKLKQQEAWAVWLYKSRLIGINSYLNPNNIKQLIPTTTNPYEFPVVFLCVDNHKTRYEIQRYVEDLDDVLLINGGNSKTEGNVTIYERRGGVALDPTMYEIYPEVAAGDDLRPDERHCTDVAPKNNQTAIVNNMIASIMLAKFTQWLRHDNSLWENSPRLNEKGEHIQIRNNEVVVNLENMTMRNLQREKPKGTEK